MNSAIQLFRPHRRRGMSAAWQRGFTLIEVGIVILIAAGILYAVIKLAGGKNEESLAAAEGTAISNLIANAQRAKVARITLHNATANTVHNNLQQAKIYPSQWLLNPGTSSTTNVKHGFGGLVTVKSSINTPNDAITLNLAGMSPAACKQISPILAKTPGIDAITVDSTTVRAASTSPSVSVDLDFGAMNTACDSSANSTVTFTFRY